MSKLNWSRVLGCGLLSGIVWILLGSAVTALLGRDFAALPNNHLGKPTPGFILFNVALDLMEGISLIWLYAVLRPLYGPGVRTAVVAAFAWWIIVSLGDATWCSFGLFPPAYRRPADDWDIASARSRHACWSQVLQGVNSGTARLRWLTTRGRSGFANSRQGNHSPAAVNC